MSKFQKSKPTDVQALSDVAARRPLFEPNTIISIPSFVVDRNGIGWWVNPDERTIRPQLFTSGSNVND